MKAEAFRDDLAARATFEVLAFQDRIAAMSGAALVGFDLSAYAHPIGYVGGGTDREWRFTHTDGTQFFKADPSPGESYGAWAMKCAEEAERERCATFAEFTIPAWLLAAPIRLMDHFSPSGGETLWASRPLTQPTFGKPAGTPSDCYLPWFTEGVRTSDEPGIAAMAANAVQPAPEPVLSVLGQQVSESELAQALALIRQKSAPAEKEAPRGLMCVRDFDHRLGAWKG